VFDGGNSKPGFLQHSDGAGDVGEFNAAPAQPLAARRRGRGLDGHLLADLLSMGDSADDVRQFAETWGLLTSGPDRWVETDWFVKLKGELVSAKMLGDRKNGEALLLKRLTPRMTRSHIEMAPEVGIYLGDVRGFLWLDLFLKYSGGLQIACCANPRCRKWYVQRAHAVHCSPACGQATWRAAQGDEQRAPPN